ncbi:MAG: acyl-CoA dehydratase activase [Desulfobacterales bacterium]|jgi:predicted CoA-substrate-specific enzyme activase
MIPANILGIDIGSVSICIAEISPEKEVIATAYRFHQGAIIDTLKAMLGGVNLSEIWAVAATTSTPPILKVNRTYDNRVSIITACRHFHEKLGSILLVGGEKFGLIQFDPNGNYLHFKANTSCAAGTGSFLDQQAARLNLAGIAQLSEIAFTNTGVIPKIASRCAVFAKTDLVHAQQEGYTLAEICDGLCHGLAKNIVDTAFAGEKPNGPVIFTGGVSRNRAVVRHIEEMIDCKVTVEKTLYGAAGAALNLLQDLSNDRWYPSIAGIGISSADDLLIQQPAHKAYYHAPLTLQLSNYPDFTSSDHYEFQWADSQNGYPVEVDVYRKLDPGGSYKINLGIDIGSTSTKAMITGSDQVVLAGFYTRTAGRPVAAIQNIFAAIADMAEKKAVSLNVIGAGTTGSGRKFAGKIIGADLIVDEITAHARAACQLNPQVDTIIEIGGQDSKFTTLKNGTVTFSIMNTVCAAGTGSFIEEQAHKLGCALDEFSGRTEDQKSPLVSDRCTVFMERDMNHYLTEGYTVDEVLASVLHAVRENYLTKVAIENNIGKTILFQGATAKNKALVAAFEQRLNKPIHVSRYCHLTGALGTAILLSEQNMSATTFRGLNLYKKRIPVQSEVCDLCTNHCKLTLADVGGERVAYGFLCGRDYDTANYVSNNRCGFDLLRERKKAMSFKPQSKHGTGLTIGIPAALHLYEDLVLWQKFFDLLGIETVTSEKCSSTIKVGKQIAAAEFCAPLTALHGHIKHLLTNPAGNQGVDFIFMPFYFEKKVAEKGVRRHYCYYTQFSPSVIAAAAGRLTDISSSAHKLLMPLLNYLYSSFHTKVELYRMLKSISKKTIGFLEVSAAYDRALEFKKSGQLKLKELYKKHLTETGNDIHTVLLGRPYTVLCPQMNKGIPDIFASLGIKAFYQDMLSYRRQDVASIQPLLCELHWHYAANIMEAAEIIAKSKGAYPVLMTSFKCSPDSFVVEYFKKIMESHAKPYLILQLDEHDATTGYETRIEAAVRYFRNHSRVANKTKPKKTTPALISCREKTVADKTLILPAWDNLSLRLVVAGLRRVGIDARLMEETPTHIQKSLRYNSGQCIPLNIIAQEFIDYVESHQLDPAKTALWMVSSTISCNLGLFPHHIKTLLDAHGQGMENVGIYTGSLSFADISLKLPLNTYLAYMMGGLVRRIGCKIRPYEEVRGTTDRVIKEGMDVLAEAFSGNLSKEKAVAEVVSRFEAIETIRDGSVFHRGRPRPKVAIFGDLYARDNEVINQDLIHFIEEQGGEVITTPYSSFVQMIAKPYLRKWFIEGHYLNVLSSKAFCATAIRLEKIYYSYFNRILKESPQAYNESPQRILSQYNLRIEHSGESMDNILKVFYIKRHYPDVSLFVQTSPAFCCPSLVTEAMSKEIENKTGVPVVSITYDGTGGKKNEAIIPYLKFPRKMYHHEKGEHMPQRRVFS